MPAFDVRGLESAPEIPKRKIGTFQASALARKVKPIGNKDSSVAPPNAIAFRSWLT